jgi:hypothetical protein
MALPTCDPWPANTVNSTDQQAACTQNSAMAAQWQLLGPNFKLFVLDALQRLARAGVEGFQQLSQFQVCDGEANARNLHCAGQFVTPPFQYEEAQIDQIIAWQLANALCANNA